MNNTAISRYIANRILANADWYEKKSLISHYEFNALASDVFFVLNFTSMLALDEGHTVVMIPNDDTPSDMFGLEVWQVSVLNPAMVFLAGQLKDGQNFFDFGQYFVEICELRQHSPHELPSYLRRRHDEFKQLLLQSSCLASSPTEISLLFMAVLSVFDGVRHELCDDFEQFVSLLSNSVFFADFEHGCNNGTPLIIRRGDAGELYVWSNRAWQAESMTMHHIWRICGAQAVPFEPNDLPDSMNDEQRQAVTLVARSPFAIITGGPGTGKTFTVAQIVLALLRQNPQTNLALAAPTGKAAQRMGESLQKSLEGLIINIPEPKTIHRLLGIGHHGNARYHEHHPLSHDVIIIDEASMLGVELSCALLAAVKTGARLILLGDAHQLSAVEAGAVLFDLCRVDQLKDHRVHLVKSKRFASTSGVGKLAMLVNDFTGEGSALPQLRALIAQHQHQLSWVDVSHPKGFLAQLITPYQAYFEQSKILLKNLDRYTDEQKINEIKGLINTLNQYRILTASHVGLMGDAIINEYIAKNHQDELHSPAWALPWHHGRVVMVQANRYDLGLFNGDIGVCIQEKGELFVYFDGIRLKKFSVRVLGGETVATAYAMTVHKSQGSEFDTVAVVFDDSNRRLLSKELIYTAVTRAKECVQIYTTPSALDIAITTPTIRTTGLERLNGR